MTEYKIDALQCSVFYINMLDLKANIVLQQVDEELAAYKQWILGGLFN